MNKVQPRDESVAYSAIQCCMKGPFSRNSGERCPIKKGGKGLTKWAGCQQELRPLCHLNTKRPQVSQAPWSSNLPSWRDLAIEELLGGLQGREGSVCWDAADHLPHLFLQEVFQNSPSPFCLLRTLSAGEMAGVQVPPCGSEQDAQHQGRTGVPQTQQHGAGISFPLATSFSTAPLGQDL